MLGLVATLNPTLVRTRVSRDGDTADYGALPLSEKQIELRRLVKGWMTSGPNLRKMFAREPALDEKTRHGTTLFYPAGKGRGYLDWFPKTPEAHLSTAQSELASPEDHALREFMVLITNPQWETLGGPCRRCGKFFIKESNRLRVYCSKSCGSRVTAFSAVQKQRQTQKQEKIRLAVEAIEKWQRTSQRIDWKDWVASHAKLTTSRTQLTTRWITRAVNQGYIQPPSRRTRLESR